MNSSSPQARFTGKDRAALGRDPILKAYEEHYKRFDKTYHVLLQLEIICLQRQAYPHCAALVEAMFMAEMRTACS